MVSEGDESTHIRGQTHVVFQRRVVSKERFAICCKVKLVGACNLRQFCQRNSPETIQQSPAYMLHLLRILDSVILLGCPPARSVLGKDGNVVPAGPSMAIWNFGIVSPMLGEFEKGQVEDEMDVDVEPEVEKGVYSSMCLGVDGWSFVLVATRPHRTADEPAHGGAS